MLDSNENTYQIGLLASALNKLLYFIFLLLFFYNFIILLLFISIRPKHVNYKLQSFLPTHLEEVDVEYSLWVGQIVLL